MQLHRVGCKNICFKASKSNLNQTVDRKKNKKYIYIASTNPFFPLTAKIRAICNEIRQQREKIPTLMPFNYMSWQVTNERAHVLAFWSRHLTRSCEARAAAAAAAASTHSQLTFKKDWVTKWNRNVRGFFFAPPPPQPPVMILHASAAINFHLRSIFAAAGDHTWAQQSPPGPWREAKIVMGFLPLTKLRRHHVA